MRSGRQRWYDNVLSIPEGQSGDVQIKHRLEPAGVTMQTGNMRTAIFGQRSESVTFEGPTTWHTLSEVGYGTWMTDLPIEQRQTDELILKASGRVLVGGLGLGYAVVALAQRPQVKEIVVVERSADVGQLVWEATLAKVPDPSIVTLVTEDLFDYLKRRPSFFAWALFDIWQSDGEHTFHETVVPLRQLAHGMVRTVECWNENVMRAQLMNGMQMRLMFLDAHARLGGPSLEQLATPHQSMYTDWAVPFWRWYQQYRQRPGCGGLDDPGVQLMMAKYVQDYGRPERPMSRSFTKFVVAA